MKITVKSLSYSTYSSFINCPQQFFYSKILKKRPVGVSANLPFGSGVHAAAEYMYRRQQAFQEPPEVDVLMRIFQSVFDHSTDVIYGEKQPKEQLFSTARQLLTLLVNEPPVRVIAVEHEILVPVDGFYVIGRIDLLTEDQNGLILWDIKTGAKKYSDEDLKRVAQQLALYGLGISKPVRYAVKTLLKLKEPRIENLQVPVTQADHQEIIEQLLMVKDAMECGKPYRIRSYRCETCGFKHLCDPNNQKENTL
ncbi:MAG: hypothetical protein A2268_00895 [Candidatus Raymondbacteria bacterium RifOxyA12_full_50_37]|uniref:PD-(D/E)XK endonuclease-like domain-containing protein n=1 Tax=Candidatus Raymondbacteria bacterium RIFOXYD12_FULL_49_13 TaxID=1817890 RepID=A0A1F7FFX3_UNCRA|nr:MAG: hypothetical protein A2268_00895 [Candidatus Raymondbacteria bacterium RifOxyA12_full_50_37]OGJ86360.1 MAG: hypothetical protein A2248_13860 [Candidatus Raymondbacteria bacterium RIFOXYA2_FULL_49_16]OGJ95530.1 MAG: hypothetical protein A2453_12635 [Candidatus Raymondbacteria bacterium RIFOXYC2_FULL_50_21]OGJ96107.1 MAG: hypothetical protein A2487_01750 [Candidatus Raymondbacteria bacterium RifOxyC12_full_50_8]OGJ96259.1 MAG: hypothetical protein A2350_02335 [Candidatus Raymondbacteria b